MCINNNQKESETIEEEEDASIKIEVEEREIYQVSRRWVKRVAPSEHDWWCWRFGTSDKRDEGWSCEQISFSHSQTAWDENRSRGESLSTERERVSVAGSLRAGSCDGNDSRIFQEKHIVKKVINCLISSLGHQYHPDKEQGVNRIHLPMRPCGLSLNFLSISFKCHPRPQQQREEDEGSVGVSSIYKTNGIASSVTHIYLHGMQCNTLIAKSAITSLNLLSILRPIIYFFSTAFQITLPLLLIFLPP